MKTKITAYQQRLEKRRLKAAALFRQGKTQAEVARRLRVSPEAARLWHNAWKTGGKRALNSKGRAGKPVRLTNADKRRIERVLMKGPGAYGFSTPIWTLERIRQVIRKETGVRYHPAHVWKVLTGMGWSRQKPEQRARERDEAKIRKWVEETWPGIKKGEVTIL